MLKQLATDRQRQADG